MLKLAAGLCATVLLVACDNWETALTRGDRPAEPVHFVSVAGEDALADGAHAADEPGVPGPLRGAPSDADHRVAAAAAALDTDTMALADPVGIQPPEAGRANLVVRGSGVIVRAGPGKGSRMIGRLGRGDRLVEVKRQQSWVQVRVEGAGAGREGWVHESLIESAAPARKPKS